MLSKDETADCVVYTFVFNDIDVNQNFDWIGFFRIQIHLKIWRGLESLPKDTRQDFRVKSEVSRVKIDPQDRAWGSILLPNEGLRAMVRFKGLRMRFSVKYEVSRVKILPQDRTWVSYWLASEVLNPSPQVNGSGSRVEVSRVKRDHSSEGLRVKVK